MQCLEGKIGILNKASEVKYTNIISRFEEQTKLAAISVKTGIEANKISKEGYIATKEKYTKEFADEVAKELGTEAYKAPAEINGINKEGYTVVYYIDTEGNEQTNGKTYIVIWYTDNGLRSTLDRDSAIEKYSLTDLATNKSVNQTVLVRVISIENYSSELSDMVLTSSIDADGINEEIGDIKKSSFKNKGNEDGTSIKTINNRILPKEYQQVEYIESTGTQYINTKLYPNDTMIVEVDTVSKSEWSIFGGDGYSHACFNLTGNVSRSFRFGYTSYNNSGFKYTERATIIFGRETYLNGKLIYTFPKSTFTGNYNLILFGRFNNSSTLNDAGDTTIFYLKIWNHNKLTRNYIPCYSTTSVIDVNGKQCPTGTIGMYDLVEGKFYTNQGTGTFKKGNDV